MLWIYKRWSLALGLAWLLWSFCPVSAKDLSDSRSGCHLTVPDDWMIPPPEGSNPRILKAVSGKLASGKAVTLTICPVPPQIKPEMMPAFILEVNKQLETEITNTGAKITAHDRQKMGDYEFNIFSASHAYPVGDINSSIWITFVGGNMYEIVIANLNSDPLKEADLVAVLKSFAIAQK